jgi:hypothetical protein
MTKREIKQELNHRLGIDAVDVMLFKGRYFAIEPTPITEGYWVHEIFFKCLSLDYRVLIEVDTLEGAKNYINELVC